VEQDNQYEAAFQQHLNGNLIRAESLYREILSVHPEHVEAMHCLGILLHQSQKSTEGLCFIRHALELDQSSAIRYNELGNILCAIGELSEAEIAFRNAVLLDDQDANVWNNLASCLHHQKKLLEAEQAYRFALALDKNFVPALNNLSALLAELKREVESTHYACLAYIQPPLSDKTPKILGYAYYTLGRIQDAAECYRQWLQSEPDNAFAKHHLAACTGENMPDKADDEYVAQLFDDMAAHFEEKLLSKLGYAGPTIISNMLDTILKPEHRLTILDGGCGTGLCGSVLAPYAKQLIGVDISQGMLAIANEKNIYDELILSELSCYLENKTKAFDLVVLADTLIYIGDLSLLFRFLHQSLRENGLFAFTVETHENLQNGFQLCASGRFQHSQAYLKQVLDENQFRLLSLDEVNLRKELGKSARAYAILAQI
jgi:predicted TPR repeat methyltransferase